ncbi:PGC-1 and ERR-induced regulator in muscle protein 1 [Pogona vitticeps]
MENFEYSILLNDRDWAEFYLASEECSLIPPALATAEEQVLSDLEEGEAEENRSIRVRVGPVPPVPVHNTASCLSHGVLGAQLFAEDVLSGSEDETDLGSVSRFLCGSNNLPASAGFPQSSCPGEYQLPCAALKPLQGQCGEARPVAGLEAVFATKEGEPERGQRPINSDCPSTVEAASPLQEENLREQSPGHQGAEIPACPVGISLEATEGMEHPVGEKENAPLCSELQLPKEESVSVDVPLPTSIENTAVLGNAEPLAYPSSMCFCSPLAPEPGGTEDPEKSAKPLQVVLTAEAKPFQEKKPSLFQEHLVLAGKALVSLDPLSESHTETPPERVSQREKSAMDLKEGKDGRKDVSSSILEGRQADQGRLSTCDKVEQPFPGGLEGNMPLNPTQAAASSCEKTLDKHRETAASAGMAEDGRGKKHSLHLGMDASVQEGPYPVIEGGRRSEFGRKPILCGLTVEDSLESHLTDLTLAEMYDCFWGDDGKEEGGKVGDGHPSSYTATELPEMDGPEMYEYFFSEMDVAEEGLRDEASETFLSSDLQSAPPSGSEDLSSEVAAGAMPISIPEVYEHFFASGTRDRRSWRAFLLSVPAAEAKKAARALKSLLRRPASRLRSQPMSPGALLRRSSQGKLVLLSPRLLDESRLRPQDGGMTVMQPERPLSIQPVLTPRDMCLGFVAFAAWAVKTSDLQAPDAWKIVLLANFGSLSAIRYFRRQVITEGWHGT